MNEEEFEELFGNTPFENIKKIQHYIDKNYIQIQKVKDKIKKLEIKKEKARGERDILERFAIEKSINSLQELLYGRNK